MQQDGKTPETTTKTTVAKQEVKNKIEIKEAPKTEKEKRELIDQSGIRPANVERISSRMSQVLANLPAKSQKEVSSAAKVMQTKIESSGKIPEPSNSESSEGFLSKAWNWITWGAGKAKDVKEASGEEASKASGYLDTAGKATEVYKDVNEASEAFDRVNDKINSNKITQEQGRLLKVGYALGKAVKWVCKKIPVVGDAAGDVADGAFRAGMKTGEKIAEHTTKTNKCIDDPLSDDCID